MKPVSLAALVAALIGPTVATAQAVPLPPFDLERLSLDPSAVSSMVVGTGEVRPKGESRVSLALHYENRPLVLRDDGALRGYGFGSPGSRAGDVVGDRVTFHLGGSVQPTESLELNLRVPIIAWQHGTSGLTSPEISTSGFGSVAVGLRWQAGAQGAELPINIAFAGEAKLPGGAEKALAGTDSWAFTPRVEFGRRSAQLVWGAQVGALLRRTRTDFGGGASAPIETGTLGSEFQYGAVVATTGAPLRGELSWRGSIGQTVERTGELLAGGRYAFCGGWEAFALGGPGFFEAPGTPRFRGLVGLAYVPPAPKPAPAPTPVAAAPAPAAAPPVDPCAPGQAHTAAQCPALDDDGDGVLNKDDACPNVPGLVELKGCPAKDSDGDGVPDHLDKCPTVPGVADAAGCPPAKAKLNAATGKIDVLEKVYFDTGKATIQARSYPVLDEVAQVLKDNPSIAKVRVEGHTDDTGEADYNIWLSGERAKAVKAYLVGKGVEAGRLDSKGYGPAKPLGDNKTKEGREQNRRVEFTIP